MGQKVNPIGLRVGVIRDWDARWYANDKNYVDLLHEDFKIRKFVKAKLFDSGISSVIIERTGVTKVKITVHTAKPGIVIGRQGAAIEVLRGELKKMTGKDVFINVIEVKKPDADAQLIAESVADSLVRRMPFRRAMKQALQRAKRAGAKGMKIAISGRLAGADIARTEWASEGKVPLHTLRANIDYGFYEADTTYGKIGVKVWIYNGEVLPEEKRSTKKEGGR
jgi:ribosomal protein S3